MNYPPISTTSDGVSADALVWFMNGSQLEAVDGDTGKQVVTTSGAACDSVPSMSFPIAVKNRIVVSRSGPPVLLVGEWTVSRPSRPGRAMLAMRGSCGLLLAAGVGAGCSQSRRRGAEGGRQRAGGRHERRRGAAARPAPAEIEDAAVVADAEADGGDDASIPTCITPTTPQSCAPPEMTALPICNLSQTGCMDPNEPHALRRQRRVLRGQ